jgi:small conductance mechanosensitive channel
MAAVGKCGRSCCGSAAARVKAIPGVVTSPAPVVAIDKIDGDGATLCVQPSTRPENYWEVYYATNRAIAEVGGEFGWLKAAAPAPATPEPAAGG